ncbi:hypothetical protein ACOSQ3_020083 [Xanthoceras sorbifolium]
MCSPELSDRPRRIFLRSCLISMESFKQVKDHDPFSIGYITSYATSGTALPSRKLGSIRVFCSSKEVQNLCFRRQRIIDIRGDVRVVKISGFDNNKFCREHEEAEHLAALAATSMH